VGHVFADIELGNAKRPDLSPIRVKALADTGALMMCVPEHVALQLELETQEQREVTVADGRKQKVAYVGPLVVRFERRSCFVGALVLGDEVLLGTVPIDDMDLVVNPGRREITVNPESPNIPHSKVY
jgi:clan AA aspartic protease